MMPLFDGIDLAPDAVFLLWFAVCTRKQNGRSRGKHVAKTSRYKGVYLDKASGKWRAIIQPDGGARGLGAHGTEREAARAYNKAAIEEFGTFARLNEVEDDGR